MAKHMASSVQGQSNSPAKRHLEETIVAELIMDPACDVIVVPHLYDLTPTVRHWWHCRACRAISSCCRGSTRGPPTGRSTAMTSEAG